jgi:hypothetical protein
MFHHYIDELAYLSPLIGSDRREVLANIEAEVTHNSVYCSIRMYIEVLLMCMYAPMAIDRLIVVILPLLT